MASRNPLDRDNVPEQRQGRKIPRGTLILWLVATSSALLLLPLYFIYTSFRSDVVLLNDNLQIVQASLADTETLEPEDQELADELARVQESVDQIEKVYSTIATRHIDWPAVMAAIGNYSPAQITLTSITQADSITLKGQAIDDTTVVAYSRSLEETGLFSRVVVQSLMTIATPFVPPTATAVGTPGPTPTSTAAITPTVTPTPTPDPYDEYETDDFQSQPIFFGQPQLHNFYPVYDVDRVKFLAKAGRYYRVFTSDLMPGVDTFLTVNVGGAIHTNDDRGPGDLSSEILFQVTTGYDVDATVRVTNRGQYGPNMRYQITVEEVVPTPTPTPTPTPVPPTATPTPAPPTAPPTPASPTATSTPVPPTPTPDLRDDYEPDDNDPQPIAIGETQAHNFYPDDDVDQVTFGVKAGRLYALGTFNLSEGTDTMITVKVNGEVCEETDYQRCESDDVGPGFLESEVRFVPNEDGSAVATISKGASGQYGDDKTYDLTLSLLSTSVDVYEPDDVNPKPIPIGPIVEETQPHNFHPDEDIDQVKFVAKDGRYYRISTSDLEPGVDTFLTVIVGGKTYTDDDSGLDPLSSKIEFQVTTGHDVEAIVKATNRGQYGPDIKYYIAVEEITSTSSRLPGVASLISSNSEAVEFVIVLELAQESP